MSASIPSVTDADFDQQVLHAPGPVLVDFWAEWCNPCRQLLPVLDEVAEQYAGAVLVRRVNADDNRNSVARCNVRGLPTLVLFVAGVEQQRLSGAVSKTRIAGLLDRCLESR